MSSDLKRLSTEVGERKFSYDRFFHLAVKIVLLLSVITCFLFGLHSLLCSLIKQLMLTAVPESVPVTGPVWPRGWAL